MDNNKNLHNIVDMIEDDYKIKKVKESSLLLKQKMCKTHDLIKQYTEKVRETDRLKLDLEVTKKDANSMKSKYKSATDETRKLELQIAEDKFKNEKLSNKIDECEINIAADKQIIQQLTCKIKELEDECSAKIMEYDLQKSFYKGKIKDLEHELEQKPKVTHKRKEKKIISDNSDTVKLTEAKSNSDIGINVSLCDSELSVKSVQEKSIMTDEFYNIKDDPHPLFCAKCESRLPLALTPEKICKTMCSYPELIEKNFSSSNEILPSRLIPNTYPDSTNRNEDVLSRALSTSSYLNLCSQYNDSTADNWKSQSIFHSTPATMQNCENDELKNADFTTHTRIATKSSRSNLGSISESSSSFQSVDCVREDSYSNDLLAKHSSSIEEIKKQIGLLERQMKKLKRLKEKPNTNSCHCVMKYNDSALLNSNLFAIICKGIAEYYDKRTKTCSKNARDIYSEKDKKGKLKRHRLNKYNENKSASLWKIENVDERYLQDKEKLYNKSEDTKKATTCDILQSKLCINKCNEISYVNESNKFLSDIDDCDKKKFIFCKENALNSAERTSIEDVLTMSHLSSPDKLYDNIEEISNNSFNEDNVKSIDMDCQTKIEMKVSSCNSDISIDDADNRIADVILEENKIKRKNQNKAIKYNDRLLKKIRNLKRKAQANSHVNTEESIELYSDDYKPVKKLRIAHTPKTAVFQPSTDQDFTPCTIQSKSNSKTLQQKNNRRLSTQILKDNLLTKNKENCTISKKCDEKNADEFSETNSIDDKRCTRKIFEKNLVSTNNENCLQNDNNLNLSVRNIKCASTVSEFDKRNDVSIEDTRKESISKERLTIEMSKNCREFDVSHNNVPDDTTKDLKLEKTIPLQTQVIIQSESGVHCKDSKCDIYKFTENLQIEATDITKKGISPSIELKYIYNAVKDKSDCGNHEASKNMNTNESISNQPIVMKATGHENHNNHDVSNEVPEIQYLQRDSEVIVENCTDDNGVDVSLKKVRNTLGEQEDVCANDKLTEIHTVEFQQENAQEIFANQQDKETKFNNVEQFQTPMFQLTKYINTKCVNHKLSQKKTIYNCTITDKFVKKQLRRLANSTWENSVHYDVVQKLTNTCGPRIIAKCIVEFLLEDVELDQTLDKSFTPPAPLMTTFEQKITALLIDLEVSKPTVSHFVQVAIEYKLFKLHGEVKTRVDSLTRMYLVLSRIQKDRGKVRIMCCNALYCMNLMSINVLYTVFTSWPEVLPNAEINKEILPTCIAFLIGSQRIHGTPSQKLLKRLLALKGLVLTFYKYAYTKQARDDIVKELITLLKTKRTNGLDTAIILVAKREGSSWTYTNIIQSTLLPMIINYEHPCIYSAFSLLGKLMRAFPSEDEGNIVLEISEQLRDLIQSGQGTHDQQEGIISALLSISRQKFDIVAPSIIKWTPSKPLRPTIIAQLQTFINTRNRKFWKNYLQRIESQIETRHANYIK